MSFGSRIPNAPKTTLDDRARKAVRKFYTMLPTLNAYVRTISGNPKVCIEVTADNGSSTRDRIYFRPPLALGDDLVHTEMLCDERDSDGIQMCDACRTHEHIMAVMYHEIGHIAFGTHSKPALKHVQEVRTKANWFSPKDWDDVRTYNEFNKRLKALPDADHSYMFLANVTHPHLGLLYNATEDARVNEAVFNARRGVRAMYDALTAEVVRDGVPNPDNPEEYTQWRDMSLEFQMMLAISYQLQGQNEKYSGLFAEKIYEDLENETLQRHLGTWTADTSAMGNLNFTLELMKILNDMGYLIKDNKEEPENDGGDSSGEDSPGDGNGEPSSGKGSPPVSDSEDEGEDSGGKDGDDQPDSSGDQDADASSDGDDSDDSPSPGSPEDKARPGGNFDNVKVCVAEQLEPDMKDADLNSEDPAERKEAQRLMKAIESAISQVIHFEKASRHIYGVEFIEHGTHYWPEDETQTPEVDSAALNLSILQARVTFDNNKRKRKMPNLKAGKVTPSTLGKRAALEDDRLFHKTIIPGRRDYDVVIGMDISGSTAGRNIVLEKNAVYAQAMLLSRLGITFSIYGHSGSSNLMIWKIKERHDQWDTKTMKRLMDADACAANLDGHALEFLRKRSSEGQATDKIIMYYSDGAMPMENYKEELEILQREIRTCAQQRITLVGVGIRTDSPTKHGLDTVRVDSPDDLKLVLLHLKKYLLKKRA